MWPEVRLRLLDYVNGNLTGYFRDTVVFPGDDISVKPVGKLLQFVRPIGTTLSSLMKINMLS